MRIGRGLSRIGGAVSLWLGVYALLAGSVFAAPPNQMTKLGPEDENKQISVTLWLNLHNKEALDALVQDMYDESSPNYHHFLTMAEYKAEFAPRAEDAAVVREFLTAHHLRVTTIDQNNHFLVAQGRVGDAQAAFNVKINRVMVNGAARRMAESEATVTGAAAPLVATVQGLSGSGPVREATGPPGATPGPGAGVPAGCGGTGGPMVLSRSRTATGRTAA